MLKKPVIERDCQRSRGNINRLGGFAKYSVQLDAEPTQKVQLHSQLRCCTTSEGVARSQHSVPEGSSSGRRELLDGN
jgi:hypothetical protein